MTWTLGAVAILLAFGADRASKAWVLARPAPVGRGPLWPRFSPRWNGRTWDGRAATPGRQLATWLAAFAAAVVLAAAGTHTAATSPIGVGLALGGGAGNLVDRLRGGSVLDFIDLGRAGVCNLADLAVGGGLALAVAGEIVARIAN